MSNSMNEPDFEEEDSATIAPATDEAVQRSEQILGVRLPGFYKRLLKVRNGGVPYRRFFDVDSQLNQLGYWNEIRRLVGVGGMRGIDGERGSRYTIPEWEYPEIGVVICDLISNGHDTIMLDYSQCGPDGEPGVAYIDDDRNIHQLSENFEAFWRSLQREMPSDIFP
jgi:hypothetical protein